MSTSSLPTPVLKFLVALPYYPIWGRTHGGQWAFQIGYRRWWRRGGWCIHSSKVILYKSRDTGWLTFGLKRTGRWRR